MRIISGHSKREMNMHPVVYDDERGIDNQQQINERDSATAILSTPPNPLSASAAFDPNTLVRKLSPCALNNALRKLAVSSTGGRVAESRHVIIKEKNAYIFF